MSGASDRVTTALSSFRLYLLGSFRIERDSHPIHLPRRKVESLLAYLVLYPQVHSREKLAALFWGDFSDAQARKSLRTALPILRKELGDDLLLSDRESVQLNPAFPLWVDAREFEKEATAFLSSGSPDPSQLNVDLYQGELLVDFYDDWVLPERERLGALYLKVLTRLVQLYRAQSEYERAIEFAHRILAINSADEPAHQHLMFCYVAVGNRQAALDQYDKCVRALSAELDVEPSPETTALAHWIRQSTLETYSTAARVTNLPIPASSFIGRKREVSDIKRLLTMARLVTCTGAGGSGKTRLAIQVATELLDSFRDGVWWVDLARLEDETLLPQQVAKALGVPEEPGRPLVELLLGFLWGKQLLLVIDNCEHVIDACAQLAASLLSASPDLKILATSREGLRIDGENLYPVPTLTMPPPAAPLSSYDAYESIRLFVERARGVKSDFVLDDENAPAIAQICQRLDGIPLAIELAAARMKLLTPQHIAARLDDRFNLLKDGSRTALPRQQTLRAAIDWSYDLLPATAQTLFRRLSLFAGGFTLDAAEGVGSDEDQGPNAIVEEVSRLVDRSLVKVEHHGAEARYRMLETIREYALDKLKASGEMTALRARHWNYYFQFASQTDTYGNGPEERRWASLLELEFPNIRTALNGALENGNGDDALELLSRLWPLWLRRGYFREGVEWYQRALAQVRPGEWSFARGLEQASQLHLECGNHDRARQLLNQALSLAQAHDDRELISRIWNQQGQIEMLEGDFAKAIGFLEESLRTWREFEPKGHSQWTPDVVREHMLYNLAESKIRSGDLAGAKSILEQVLAEVEKRGDGFYMGWGLGLQAERALIAGELDQAYEFSQQSLKIKVEIHDQVGVAYSLDNLALVAMEQGQLVRATVLLSAAGRLRELLHAPRAPYAGAEIESRMARLRRLLSSDEFAKAWARGRALDLTQVAKYAETNEEP